MDNKGHRKRSRSEDILTFEEAFAPLAYHLFPDGCPWSAASSATATITGKRDNIDTLKDVWPQSQNRSIVSANEALLAVKRLQRLGKSVGFQSPQQDALVLAACATLVIPPSSTHDTESSVHVSAEEQGVVKRSKIRDGTSLYFRELLRMVLPQRQQPISKYCVLKLLSTLRRDTNNDQQLSMEDDMGMICTLQFLTLSVRNGALSGEARRTLSSMYSVLFPLAMKAALCGDAVRLLHAITRRSHVRVYRAQRLREFYVACPAEQQVNFAPLWLLLQLYANYDPQGCGGFFASSSSKKQQLKKQQRDLKGYAGCFSFPDLVWERNFHRTWQRDINSMVDPTSCANQNHQDDPSQTRQTSSSAVLVTMDRLVDSFEGVQSFSSGFGPNKKRSLRASDLLNDTTLTHLLVVSSPNNTTSESGADGGEGNVQPVQEVARLKVCLPFMLQQEWYHQAPSSRKNIMQDLGSDINEESESDSEESLNSDSSNSGTTKEDDTLGDSDREIDSKSIVDNGVISAVSVDNMASTVPEKSDRSASRRRVVEALASVATQTGTIPPEAESMIDEIVRSWDGTEDWGVMLCYDILPSVSTTNTFSELRGKLLVYVERLFLFGTCKLQHAIVSGTLASLLGNIAGHSGNSGGQDQSNNHQRKLIKELIHWTDGLLLQGFLSKRDGESELLSSAAIDFFHVACHDVTRHSRLLVLPSTSLVYRLLLSKSPVTIDRVCQLLVDYKGCFQCLKQGIEKAGSSAALQVEGLDQ